MKYSPPVVLSLSGHDPTGGAGIQADIETLARLGCYPCTVITALTAQDTLNVRRVMPQAAADFLEQARLVLEDMQVSAIKIGLLGSTELVRAVESVLDQAAGVPVVLDPILAAGGGQNLADGEMIAEIKARLIPRATVLTPNIPEARRLAGSGDSASLARELMALGCPNILLTGAHEESPDVVNRWYSAAGVKSYRWPRLPENYHGSGCTLASAVAGCLARGLDMEAAVKEAQGFTWWALNGGYRLGRGQLSPNRTGPG